MRVLTVAVLFSLAFGGALAPVTHSRDGVEFVLNVKLKLGARQGYTFVSIDGGGVCGDVGRPQMPALRTLLRIPESGDFDVAVWNVEVDTVYLPQLGLPGKVFPRQPPRPKWMSSWSTVEDAAWYRDSMLTLGARDWARISPIGILRGRRLGLLEVFPVVEYDPRSGRLCYIRSAVVDVSFDEPLRPPDQRLRSPVFDGLLGRVLPIPEDIPPEPNVPVVYWLIYHDDFAGAIEPLVEWKRKLGYDVVTTPISSIGADTSSLREAISDAYEGWEKPPDFVLFVGDAEQIPPKVVSSGWDSHPTDLYYFTVDGDDYLPDILYGRFPCATAEQVEAVVEKAVFYERFMMGESSFLRHPVFVACGIDGDYELAESTHRYVFTTWLTPPEYEPESLWAFDGATGEDVLSAINAGALLVDYSGHGNTDGWGNPSVSIHDIASLTNDGMYPLVISNACLTGKFDVSECFGEAWVRAPHKGAVAFIGASNSTYWIEDDIWERRWFDAVFEDGFTSIAGATFKANLELLLAGYGTARYYFEVYHNLGDPALWLYWGEPESIDVDLSAWGGVVPLGEDYLDIPVSVDGATVCLWRSDGRIGVGRSAWGSVRITPEFEPDSAGSVWVVATKPNFFKPFVELVPNEFLCVAEYSPESLHVGVDNVFSISVTDGAGVPYAGALVKVSGYGVVESTFTDSSGYAEMIINPPYEGVLSLVVIHGGRRLLFRQLPCYGAASWSVVGRDVGVESILLWDTLAAGFEGSIRYVLSAGGFTCYIEGGGLEPESVVVSGDTFSTTITPTTDMPVVFTFAKPGYVILQDTVRVVWAAGPFYGVVVDSGGSPVLGRPVLTLLHDGDTVGTTRTDWDGTFSLPGWFFCDTYTVALQGFGYYDTSYTFLLTVRGDYTFSMTPTPRSDVRVFVHDEIGTPLVAEVELLAPVIGEVVSVGERVDAGMYSLGELPYCDYVAFVRARGFKPKRISFSASTPFTDLDVPLDAASADVLVIDVSSDGVAPARIRDDLESLGYSVDLATTFPDTATMWDYNLVLYSAGDNSFSATAARLSTLLDYHLSGGRVVFEGGEVAYQVLEEGGFSPNFATDLLHIGAYESDDPGDEGFAVSPLFWDSLVTFFPNVLDENIPTVSVSFWDYQIFDVVRPAEGAYYFYRTAADTTLGCVLLFPDSDGRGLARSAFCGFTYNSAFVDSTDAAKILSNIVEYLLPPDQTDGAVYGEVSIEGGEPASDVVVTAIGPVTVVDTTEAHGRFSFAAKAGPYSITFSRADCYDTTLSCTVDPEVPLRLDVVLRRVGFVSDARAKSAVVGIPVPNPFNDVVVLPFENAAGLPVRLCVRDPVGRIVYREGLGAPRGGYIRWAPQKTPAGVYLLEVTVGKQSFVRKVLYIK